MDTNILGHIFEHSLNELDEKTAQAVGQTADKSKTKRKKDELFTRRVTLRNTLSNKRLAHFANKNSDWKV
ncbi:MAG: hypothetical protein RIS64_406 [Bacteroidota bacterium]